MLNKKVLLLGLLLLAGGADCSAQISVLNKIKNKAKQMVKKEISPSRAIGRSKTSSCDKDLQKRYDAMMGPGINRNAEDTPPTVPIPDQTTALLEPLGYPLDEKEGRSAGKIVLPPLTVKGQEKWEETLPFVTSFTNKRLFDEFVALKQFIEDHPTSEFWPLSSRIERLSEELSARCDALDKYVKAYNESKDEDKTAEYEWGKTNARNYVVRVIGGDAYKRVVRSPIDVYFTSTGKGQVHVAPETEQFFNAHGGWSGATTVAWTKWDPEPNKGKAKTSVEGQQAVVNYTNNAGAQVDLNGVIYYLHNKGNGGYAIAHECNKVAVRGKDMVIPQHIDLNGRKYPVIHLVGGLFNGAEIKSVTLPEGLTEIQGQVFRNTAITEIIIPSTVVRVGGSAFSGCKRLSKVVFLPKKMEIVDREAFAGCTSLTSVHLPASVERLGDGVFKESAVSDVVLPQNITSINSNMFEGCKSLKTLQVPTTVKTIEGGAFMESGLTSIEIPSVTAIDEWAFNNCKSLKSVVLNKALKENFFMGAYQAFDGCTLLEIKPGTKELYYPAGFKFVEFK